MCQVLEVSEKGICELAQKRQKSEKRDDEFLTERIEDAYYENRGHYGSPRIHAELKHRGCIVQRKRVARLMREHQAQCQKKRRKYEQRTAVIISCL